jgi:TusA-related sulfurtransferase
MDEASQITGMDPTLAGDGPVDELGFVRVHHFDAGTMGCADGLADAFRDRIRAIPLGDYLVVVAQDPAAKGDLPSLARMLGQTIRSTEAANDGRLLFTIERTR